jgi:hypothetical protein
MSKTCRIHDEWEIEYFFVMVKDKYPFQKRMIWNVI